MKGRLPPVLNFPLLEMKSMLALDAGAPLKLRATLSCRTPQGHRLPKLPLPLLLLQVC